MEVVTTKYISCSLFILHSLYLLYSNATPLRVSWNDGTGIPAGQLEGFVFILCQIKVKIGFSITPYLLVQRKKSTHSNSSNSCWHFLQFSLTPHFQRLYDKNKINCWTKRRRRRRKKSNNNEWIRYSLIWMSNLLRGLHAQSKQTLKNLSNQTNFKGL